MEFMLKNGKKVLIRDVVVSDAEKCIDFMKIINTQTKNLLREPDEFNMTVEEERKFIERLISSKNDIMVSVWDGDKIISLTGFHGNDLRRINHRVSLGISIITEYRNQGLGTFLMEHIIKRAKQMGKTKMELDVRNDNPAAIKVYENVGFYIEGYRKNGFYVDGKMIDLVLMGKDL